MATIDIKKREDADLNHPDLAPAGTGWDKDWTLLVEPKDWTTRLTGRGSNLAWRGEHLAHAQEGLSKFEDTPGVYEQALGPAPDALTLIPFYFGESGSLWLRLKDYAESGSRMHDVYSDILRRNLYIFVRWRKLQSDEEAREEARRVLDTFDFAGNLAPEGASRMLDVYAQLPQSHGYEDDAREGETRLPDTFNRFGLIDLAMELAATNLGDWIDGHAANFQQHLEEAAEGQVAGSSEKVRALGVEGRAKLREVLSTHANNVAALVKRKVDDLIRHVGVVKPEIARELSQEAVDQGLAAPTLHAARPKLPWGRAADGLQAAPGMMNMVLGALPMASAGLSVVSIGLAAYNTHQLNRTVLRQLEGVTGQLDGLAGTLQGLDTTLVAIDKAVQHNGKMLQYLVEICSHGFSELQGGLNRLQDGVDNLESTLHGMQQAQWRVDVRTLQRLRARWATELDRCFRRLSPFDGLLSHSISTLAIEVQETATEKLESISHGNPVRLGLVLLRAWALRTEIDANIWDKDHFETVRCLSKDLLELEERYKHGASQTMQTASELLHGLSAGEDSKDRDQFIMLLDRTDSLAHETDLVLCEASITRMRLQLLQREKEGLELQRLVEEARRVADEAISLCKCCTIYELATTHREVLQRYVFLHRGLLLGIQEADGKLDPEDIEPWDDGLDSVRNLAEQARQSASMPVYQYPLRTLHQLNFYADLKGIRHEDLELGDGGATLTPMEIGARLGLPRELSEKLVGTPTALHNLEDVALKANSMRVEFFNRLEHAMSRAPATAGNLDEDTPEKRAIRQAEAALLDELAEQENLDLAVELAEEAAEQHSAQQDADALLQRPCSEVQLSRCRNEVAIRSCVLIEGLISQIQGRVTVLAADIQAEADWARFAVQLRAWLNDSLGQKSQIEGGYTGKFRTQVWCVLVLDEHQSVGIGEACTMTENTMSLNISSVNPPGVFISPGNGYAIQFTVRNKLVVCTSDTVFQSLFTYITGGR